MDLSVTVLFFVGVILACCCVGLIYKKIDFLKLLTIAASVYFTLFVLISGFFFWADRFNMDGVLLVEACLLALPCVGIAIARRDFRFGVEFEPHGKLIYVIILIGFLISMVKFDLYGMGQDQGVYQIKAIALADGQTKQQMCFGEIDKLPTEELKKEVQESFGPLLGYDFFDGTKPTLANKTPLGPIPGIFHGIPTFPALMALFIQMFGVANMQQVQSIFYLCAAFFVLFMTEELKFKRHTRALAVSVVALSPILHWVMKASLTEGFLTLLVAGILFGLVDKHRFSKVLSVLFVWGFAFFHVTIYVMMPLFTFLLVLMYLETKDKNYLWLNVVASAGLGVGITMMQYVAPTYAVNNILNGFSFFTSQSQIMPFMLAYAVVLAAAPFLVRLAGVQKGYATLKKERVFSWIIRVIMILLLLLFVWRGYQICTGQVERLTASLKSVRFLAIVMYAYGTGIFAFVLTLVFMFLKPKRMTESKETIVISAAFFYAVLFMSALIRKEVYYLYYYARYLVPYIPVCALMIGVMLNELSKRALTCLLVGGAVVLLPFDWTLATQKDLTRLEWSTLNDVLDTLHSVQGENCAVIVDGDYCERLVTFPIKTGTNMAVYPGTSDVEGEAEALSEVYDDIYIITEEPDALALRSSDYSILYRNHYTYSVDEITAVGKLIPFAYDFHQAEREIAIMQYMEAQLTYDFASDDFMMYNMGGVEQLGESDVYFRWLNQSEAGFAAYLDKEDYEMHVALGAKGPAELDPYTVDVAVNGQSIGNITFSEGNRPSEYVLTIPRDVVTEGENDIRFIADTWSPKDFGSGDTRELTISLSEVRFEEK